MIGLSGAIESGSASSVSNEPGFPIDRISKQEGVVYQCHHGPHGPYLLDTGTSFPHYQDPCHFLSRQHTRGGAANRRREGSEEAARVAIAAQSTQ